jgi:CMP-N-acetylneuraminic acid synthetase/spore coat polysaccharide biosynthesis predicted glycosyltransferase SpsG
MHKIIAVIPARAGSKGIPNKNIRLVGGRPLIWYALKNANESKWISRVIVTTDSEEVAIIAKHMGATVKMRSAQLCLDDVTLDEVIFDAVENEECDYVITMQPTSPTLHTDTLDRAIEYAIEKKLDTVISVINSPHLSWKNEGGNKIPNYEARLNRQYLPANYLETGAFMVSRREIIRRDTRIGSLVDVYEISEEEAVDVDNFIDLLMVDRILKKEKVAIYVNGNNIRGVGHVYRALEIADTFYSKPDIFYDINQTDEKIFGTTTHNLIGINGIAELFDRLRLEKYDIFINDILSTSIDYMIGVRQILPEAKIINFEDDGEGAYKADLVINDLYQKSDFPNVKAGKDYYISSKLFMFYDPIEIKDEVRDVFISFGGADPQNYSDRLLRIITKEKYANYNFHVVLGRAKLNVDALMDYNRYTNIEVFHDISNMPEIMSNCDIGITSRGRTSYELAILGIPTIAMAQNQREEKHGFVDREHGFDYLGCNPSDHVIEASLDMYLTMSKEERKKYQSLLLSNDLRNGRDRVIKMIESL